MIITYYKSSKENNLPLYLAEIAIIIAIKEAVHRYNLPIEMSETKYEFNLKADNMDIMAFHLLPFLKSENYCLPYLARIFKLKESNNIVVTINKVMENPEYLSLNLENILGEYTVKYNFNN